MGAMTMYVDLLSSALECWVADLTDRELLRYGRSCRDALESPGVYGATTNASVLAAEVAYDRVLIRLCQLHAIEVDTQAFMFPAHARARIEAVLRAAGIFLDGPEPEGDEP
jgi:hypothetical protein